MQYKTIQMTQKQDVTIIRVTERRIFLHIADDFRNEVLSIIDNGVPKVIIDLCDVNVMNSSGLGVLMLVRDRIDKQKGRLVVCGLQPIMSEIFYRMHLDTFFTVTDDQDEALQKLQ
jgi:anti-sigma B factor antagonist